MVTDSMQVISPDTAIYKGNVMALDTTLPLSYEISEDQYTFHSSQNNSYTVLQLSTESTSNVTQGSTNCFVLQFGDYIPWNNPDNIINYEAEDLMRKLKDLVFLPVLFLIGCPANIINMMVFYKQGLKERVNVCLFALSLADELYMVNNMMWYGEQLRIRFTTGETFGPVMQFMTNTNLIGFYGFIWVSQALTAVIASDRCFCVLQPLHAQAAISTLTMTISIVAINIIIVGLFFLVSTRYYITCAYDPVSDSTIMAVIPGRFYLRHQKLIEYLDVFFFGAGLPGVVIMVVVATTVITVVKLREAAAWREGTSSGNGLSQRDIALTKMLVGNSIFFIVCVFPYIVLRLIILSMPEMNTGRRQHNFYMMIQWLLTTISYFNATFNIVIYYTMGSRYRQTFWQLFGMNKTKLKRLLHP